MIAKFQPLPGFRDACEATGLSKFASEKVLSVECTLNKDVKQFRVEGLFACLANSCFQAINSREMDGGLASQFQEVMINERQIDYGTTCKVTSGAWRITGLVVGFGAFVVSVVLPIVVG